MPNKLSAPGLFGGLSSSAMAAPFTVEHLAICADLRMRQLGFDRIAHETCVVAARDRDGHGIPGNLRRRDAIMAEQRIRERKQHQ